MSRHSCVELTSQQEFELEEELRHAIAADDLVSAWIVLQQGIRPRLRVEYLGKCRSVEMFELLDEFGMQWGEKGHLIIPYVLDNKALVDWLLQRGADINGRQGDATIKGHDPDSEHERDNTCLVLNQAAAQGNIAMFDYLVSRGALPLRSMPLCWVARCRDPTKATAMVDHLIERYGFDPDADDNGCGGLKIWFELKSNWDAGPPICPATFKENIAVMKALLRHGARIKVERRDAMRIAIYRLSTPVLQTLLDAGGNPTDGLDYAALGSSSRGTIEWELEAARLCLERGADVNLVEQKDAKNAASGDTYWPMHERMKELLAEWKLSGKTSALQVTGAEPSPNELPSGSK